jgi:hypothetical protein
VCAAENWVSSNKAAGVAAFEQGNLHSNVGHVTACAAAPAAPAAAAGAAALTWGCSTGHRQWQLQLQACAALQQGLLSLLGLCRSLLLLLLLLLWWWWLLQQLVQQ